jgi:hypothetical protein
MSNDEISCNIEIKEDSAGLIKLFDQFTINDKNIHLDEDYILLRQFPLFKSGLYTYTFLHMDFFVDKLYQGFLFDFVRVLNKCGYTSFKYPQLKTDLGNRFSEINLFYIVMEKCFQSYGNCVKTGIELKVLLDKGEPDYFIRKTDEIFLFEFKDATLNANVKYSGNVSTIKNTLIENLN